MSDDLRATLDQLAHDTLGWEGPLPDGDLAEVLDSMDRLALVVAIEDHFEVAFEPEDDQAARTVDEVIALVRAKREAGRGGA